MDGISVIICCFNSAARLPVTLQHLMRQKVNRIPWEVILVDNASTDNTEAVARSVWSSSQEKATPLKVVSESMPGQSHARKTGFRNALYDIVVFCDDDNWLDENYLQIAHDIMSSDAGIGACGGNGKAVSDNDLPSWFENYKGYYACYPQASSEGQLKAGGFLYGAGLVVRKSLLKKIYERNFQLAIGRAGTQLGSGDDNELSYLITILNYKLWYSPRLTFKHYLPKGRLNQDYLFRLIDSVGYSSMRLIIYHYVISGKSISEINWFYDIMYRTINLFRVAILMPLIRDSFARKLYWTGACQAWRAVADQFRTYHKNYTAIMAFKNE